MHQLLASTLVAEGAGGGLTGILPFVLMIGVIYFIVLRPMSRQEKDRKKRVESLKKGDQVVIGGGILGRISNVDDEKIAIVEIADRVKIRVMKKDIVDTQANALDDKSKGKDAPKDKDKDKDAKDKDAKDTASKDKDAKDTSAKDKAAKDKDDDKAEKGAEAAS